MTMRINHLSKVGQERMIRNGWVLMLPLNYMENIEEMHKRLSVEYSDVRIYWCGTMVRGIHNYFAMCKN